MSKGNITENDFAKFIANATAMPSYGANLHVSLHTADPGEAGTQLTSESAYTGYARVSVARDASGWTICLADGTTDADGPAFKNAAEATFPECTGGSESITHVAIGTAASGAGQVLYKGALTAPVAVSNLITPRFPVGTLRTVED